MTLILDLPRAAESRLQEEATRVGVSAPDLALRMLLDRLQPEADRIYKLVADISAPIDIADHTREAIYAE